MMPTSNEPVWLAAITVDGWRRRPPSAVEATQSSTDVEHAVQVKVKVVTRIIWCAITHGPSFLLRCQPPTLCTSTIGSVDLVCGRLFPQDLQQLLPFLLQASRSRLRLVISWAGRWRLPSRC